MLPKHYVILNPDNVIGIVWIILLQVHQDLELDTCLMLESLLVPDKLNSHKLFGLMINAFEGLAKATFA